jgi:hypothetical protein
VKLLPRRPPEEEEEPSRASREVAELFGEHADEKRSEESGT